MIRIRNPNVFMPESSQKLITVQCITGTLLLYFYYNAVSSQSLFITLNTICILVNFLGILINPLVVFVQQRPAQTRNFSYGYARFEVFAVFSTVLVTLIACLDTFKDCLLRILFQSNAPTVHDEDGNYQTVSNTDGTFVTTFILLIYQLVTVFFLIDVSRTLHNAMLLSGPNLMHAQLLRFQHIFSQSKYPHLGKLMLLKINPLLMFSVTMLFASILIQVLCIIFEPHTIDTLVALVMTPMLVMNLWPLFVNSTFILIQATPNILLNQLDQVLTEVSAVEGVLEVLEHHFWTLTYGSIVGTLHIKVRRDANEQLVSSQLASKFPMVSKLTIQVIKDGDLSWRQESYENARLPSSYSKESSSSNATEPLIAHQVTLDQQVSNQNGFDKVGDQSDHPETVISSSSGVNI